MPKRILIHCSDRETMPLTTVFSIRWRRLLTNTVARKRIYCLLFAAFCSLVAVITLGKLFELRFQRKTKAAVHDSPRLPQNIASINTISSQSETVVNLFQRRDGLNRPLHAAKYSENLYLPEDSAGLSKQNLEERESLTKRYGLLKPSSASFKSLRMDTYRREIYSNKHPVELSSHANLLMHQQVEPVQPILPGGVPNRLVHFDLKGAPPKLSYFAEVFPLIKSFGATGILIEYEDMFPFSGLLQNVSARNHYSPTDIATIVHLAEQNMLDIMPLVQTFGHLEYVLKLEQFKHLREDPVEPSTLCPSKPESFDVVRELIDQVMELHTQNVTRAPLRYLHIGADEVWRLAKDRACTDRLQTSNLLTPVKIFLAHVKRVAEYVRAKYPGVTPIMWDDMFHSMSVEDLLESGIGELVEPMIWSYYTAWDRHLVSWDSLYPAVFSKIWGASAFKGSTGETNILPNVSTHASIHTSWLQALTVSASNYKQFQGIVLTGWQRYNHFSRLCELLPVSIPSLAISLNILKTGMYDAAQTVADVGVQLSCMLDTNSFPFRRGDPGVLAYDPFLYSFVGGCKFPGSRLNDVVHVYYTWHEQCVALHAFFLGYNGIVDPFQRQFSYVSPVRLAEKRPEFEQIKSQYAGLRRELYAALDEVFDQYTVDEVLHLYMDDSMKKLLDDIDKLYETVSSVALPVWKQRPLNFDVLEATATGEVSENGSNNEQAGEKLNLF